MEAMTSEYESLLRSGTWELVPLPSGRKKIGCRFVYAAKSDENGILIKFKARLVAQGFRQVEGIDYNETFAPVTRLTTIRTMCALAAHQDLHLQQMDVKTAFLNGDLEEEVYMAQPEGFVEYGKEELVCRLKRSIYGLKQSPRMWYTKLDAFLTSIGMTRSHSDHSLYTKSQDDKFLAVAVYVDDLVICSNDLQELNSFKFSMSNRFEMKDLGDLRHILGIRVTRNKKEGTIHLDQKTYIQDILARFNMTECKQTVTPMEANAKLTKALCPTTEKEKLEMRSVPYRQLIGSLMYAMTCTRPDIAYSVSKLSRFLCNPGNSHWQAAKRVLRYLKGTPTHGITYRRGHGRPILVGYADADHAMGCSAKSTSGYVFLSGGAAISWRSKLQSIVALSTAEAEYVSLAEASSECVWLRKLLEDLNAPQTHATTIHEDNQSCIALTKNDEFHFRTKHIAVKYHFTRSLIENNSLKVTYCSTDKMLADNFTKSLASPKFIADIKEIGMTAV
jgi:hypothetical protein